MNNLFATWHRTDPDEDVVDHLTRAHGRLIDIPGLEAALALVDAALLEVAAWSPPVGTEREAHALP